MTAGSRAASRETSAMSVPGALMYDHLDFLRASAVALVFLAHLSIVLGARTGLGTVAHFGVVIFFVHTSIVLFMSLERTRPGSRLFAFYLRRIFRIYPLAILTILFILISGLPPAPWLESQRPTAGNIGSNLLLIQNVTGKRDVLATLWSLPFEVQMYVVLPLLFALRKNVHSLVVWGVSATAAEMLLATWPRAGGIVRYAPCFCAGLVAFWLLRARTIVRLRFLAMPVTLAGCLITFVFVNHQLGFSAAADSLAALSVAVLTGLMDGCVPRIVSQICGQIAKYSYGIYLSHLPIMMLCFSPGWTPLAFVRFVVLSVMVPVLLYHTIEHPMIVAGGKLAGLLGGKCRAAPRQSNRIDDAGALNVAGGLLSSAGVKADVAKRS